MVQKDKVTPFFIQYYILMSVKAVEIWKFGFPDIVKDKEISKGLIFYDRIWIFLCVFIKNEDTLNLPNIINISVKHL